MNESINETLTNASILSDMDSFLLVGFALVVLIFILMIFTSFFERISREDRGRNTDIKNDKKYSYSYNKNKLRHFCGVEIECLSGKAKKRVGLTDLRKYEFVSQHDVSIFPRGVEFVSRPMQGDELFNKVGGFCELLAERGYTVNRTCGLHLHIEVPLTLNMVKKLYIFYSNYEKMFFSMLPKSRQNNKYCQKIERHDKFNLEDVMKINSLNEFIALYYENKSYNRENHSYDKRYCWVNFHSMFYRGTLEIRAHSGTVNKEKVLNWMEIHLRIMEFLRKKSVREVYNMRTEEEFMKIFRPKIREYIKKRWQQQITKINENDMVLEKPLIH